MAGFTDGVEHLLAELLWLDLLLQQQVIRLRAANLITEDELRGLYIPDAQADALLGQGRSFGWGDEPDDTQALIDQVREENEARVRESLRAGIDLPLPHLARLLGLTPFETDVLLVCVAPELDLRYETLYAYVQNDVTRRRPSVDLTLKLLCPSVEEQLDRRSVFAADAHLLRHRLIRLLDDPQDRDPSLLAKFIKVDQRVVDFLLGKEQVDARLLPFTRRVDPTRGLDKVTLPKETIEKLTHASDLLAKGGVFLFQGPYGVGKQAAAEGLCAGLGLPLLVADLPWALACDLPFAKTVALLRREATLQGAGLYLAHFEALLADEQKARGRVSILARELACPSFPIFLGSEVTWHPVGLWNRTDFLSFDFLLPEFPLRLHLWERSLHGDGRRPAPDLDLSALANKFVLSPGQIQDATQYADSLTSVRPVDERNISMEDLYTAARAQSNQGLRRLAQKIEPIYTWSDIVLPRRAMQQLHEVYGSVKYRHVVYSGWGFERKLSLGKGVNALFSGPSGTGKTMAAQILANELNLDLYKIDLSGVVSKYIGETEKNLDRIFREAQHSNAILFFDEADALFGKRSEVKDAHDRYANIEVAYLLQKMEEYDGITILATNLRKNMDEAFTRRLHHIVEFPFPDAAHRERIWQGVFPAQAPLADEVTLGFLAQHFELAGGNIRNIALAAAFMAAEEDGAICMEHLVLATARELQKMGKLPSKTEFGDYYELIRERG
jgi:hypothetical protein